MNIEDILVVTVTVAVLAGLGWFFFGPRKGTAAVLAGGVQRLEVTVKGGPPYGLTPVRRASSGSRAG